MNEQPKKCLARAIVSMALGISGVVFDLTGAMFDVMIAVFGLLILSMKEMPSYAALVYVVTYGVCVVVMVICSIICGAIAISQGKKFVALYHAEDSRMVKAGRILGTISIIAGILVLILMIPVVCLTVSRVR